MQLWSKKPDVAKYRIESGADIKAKDRNGYNALIYAVECSQFELMNILIDKGADIESRDYLGNTSLAYAASQRANIDAVKLLIKRGADVNTRNNASEPLLYLVLDMLNVMDIVAELVNAGANLLEPTKGKARLVFLGEEFRLNGAATVTVGKFSKYLANDNKLAFIDVDPGNHTIVRLVSWKQIPA
jgi:ankyrin repeat protein